MKPSASLLTLTAVLGLSASLLDGPVGTAPAAPPAADASSPPPAPGRADVHALLVGVTRYPHLKPRLSLEGPGNDVTLFRRVLVQHLGLSPDRIVTLSEAAGKDELRPTRENIRREVLALAGRVRPGDHVVLLLSGHGVQVPDQDPPRRDDPEPDGLDEAFLPADVRPWKPEDRDVPGAIRDDELRGWLRRLTDERGASVWLVADCCHSGTILRDPASVEVPRKLAPGDLGIPDADLEAAGARGRRLFGRPRDAGPGSSFLEEAETSDRLVGLYACLSSEETIERPLPPDGPGAAVHGLLTYTLCQVLSQAPDGEPLTYRGLLRRIRDRYHGWNRQFPSPLVEGKGVDRQVLGAKEWKGPPFLLTAKDGRFRVDGGRLHGLTPGSILAVYRPGSAGAPVGHVRVGRVGSLDAEVEPCAYGGLPAVRDLPERGRCQVVFADYGDLRLRVAAAPGAGDGPRRQLQDLARAPGSVLQAVDEPRQADWLLAPGDGGLYLLPAEGAVRIAGQPTPRFDPFQGENGMKEMREVLIRVARARSLLRLAGPAPAGRSPRRPRLRVNVELIRYRDGSDEEGTPVPPGSVLHPGDHIAFRVSNPGPGRRVYPTLLFIDGRYGITCVYPGLDMTVERLEPGAPFTTDVFRVQDRTRGLEHLVVIAVSSPVDFSWLEQPTIEKARAVAAGDRGGLDTALGRLLRGAFYADTRDRGLDLVTIDDTVIERVSWYTLPR